MEFIAAANHCKSLAPLQHFESSTPLRAQLHLSNSNAACKTGRIAHMCRRVLGLCRVAAPWYRAQTDFKNVAVDAQALLFFSLQQACQSQEQLFGSFYLFFLVSLSLPRAWCSSTLPLSNNTTTVNHKPISPLHFSSPVDITANNLLLLAHQRFQQHEYTITLFVIHRLQTTIIRNGSDPA